MIILFISKAAKNTVCFRNCRVEYIKASAASDLESLLKKASDTGTEESVSFIIVLDRAGLGRRQYDSLAAELSAGPGLCWAVLDCKGQIDDPAALFFMGASDYLSPAVSEAGVEQSRLEQLLIFFRTSRLSKSGKQRTQKPDLPGKTSIKKKKNSTDFPGWSEVREGVVYDFLFLYADLPEAEKIRKTLGEKRYIKLKEDFAVSINSLVQQAGGRTWMISGHSLLALLPPANADKTLLMCIEILLGSSIFIYENLHLTFSTPLNFSLHYGNSMWEKPGKTGHIISEDVNFIHHMGHKYAGKNLLSVSEEAYRLMSDISRRFLKLKGSFENHVIYCSGIFGCSSVIS